MRTHPQHSDRPWAEPSAAITYMGEFAAFVGIITTVGLIFRFSGVLVRRLDRTGGNASQFDDLDERLTELEDHYEHRANDADQRILELEERIDFAERLLGQQQKSAKLEAPTESDG